MFFFFFAPHLKWFSHSLPHSCSLTLYIQDYGSYSLIFLQVYIYIYIFFYSTLLSPHSFFPQYLGECNHPRFHHFYISLPQNNLHIYSVAIFFIPFLKIKYLMHYHVYFNLLSLHPTHIILHLFSFFPVYPWHHFLAYLPLPRRAHISLSSCTSFPPFIKFCGAHFLLQIMRRLRYVGMSAFHP